MAAKSTALARQASLNSDSAPLPRTIRGQFAPERQATGKRLSGLLAAALLVLSILTVYKAATIPDAFSGTAHSADSIRTVRQFYAGLNEFLETGDAGPVSATLEQGALSVVPARGVMGDDSGLLTYLLALRSTFPRLRFSVDEIDAGGDIAVATVRLSGTAAELPDEWQTSTEFFRIRHGRIVQSWATTPGMRLLHTLTTPGAGTVVTQPSRLVLAEFSIDPGGNRPRLIEGPAMIMVTAGKLELVGDGSSQVIDIGTGNARVIERNTSTSVGAGEAIAAPGKAVQVWNVGARSAAARIAMLVSEPPPIRAGIPTGGTGEPLRIGSALLTGLNGPLEFGSLTVRTLEIGEHQIRSGTWTLGFGWAVLGPGALLPLPAHGNDSLIQVISGAIRPVPPFPSGEPFDALLVNDGDEPVVVLTAILEPLSWGALSGDRSRPGPSKETAKVAGLTERASRDTETRRRDLLAGVARIAYRELVAWLGADFGYDPLAAYQLMTQVGGLYVANTVNTTYSLVASCPTRYLSASS